MSWVKEYWTSGAFVLLCFTFGGFWATAQVSHSVTYANEKTVEQIGDLLEKQADCREVCAGMAEGDHARYTDCLMRYCDKKRVEPEPEPEPEPE